jgi:hypothetical protein
MKDLTRTAIFVFPLTLASQNASATAAGGSRLFFDSGNCRSAFAVVSGTKACGARCSVSLQLDFLPKTSAKAEAVICREGVRLSKFLNANRNGASGGPCIVASKLNYPALG